MKPPQTEEEEREAITFELGWLTGRVLRDAGHFPLAIRERIERGVFGPNAMSTQEMADLCAIIRADNIGLDLRPE